MRTHEEQVEHAMRLQNKLYGGINKTVQRNMKGNKMSLKDRIEAMKLPGHNGPAKRKPVVYNPRLAALVAKKVQKRIQEQQA